MHDNGTRYADSGQVVEGNGLTRRSALKLGAASLFGAVAAGVLPGRSRAATIYPAPCKPGQGFNCSKNNFQFCGGPGSGCGCAFQYTGNKASLVKSYCVDFNVCCENLNTCYEGQTDCAPGYTCSNTTCCGEPVCLPPCGANVPPAACCLTPNGQSAGNCSTCTTGGTCDNGNFAQCGCNGPVEGSYCFTTAENTAICGQNMYCDEVPTCTSSSDCATGWVCIVSTGCNCSYDSGVCVPLCTTTVGAPSKRGSGMTAANIRK